MYSTHNKGKSVVAERFIRTVKNKVFKDMISRNAFIDELDGIVNKYNNMYHRTIKMKPEDGKSSIYILTLIKKTVRSPKFKVGDNVRIPKYKNNFAKGYAPNWSEEVFDLKSQKHYSMLLLTLMVKKLLEHFTKKFRV